MVRVLAAAGRLLRALAALTVLTGFTAGVPWLLTASAGWPLSWLGWQHPSALPGVDNVVGAVTSPWTDQMIFGLLATLGWILWAVFVRHVITASAEAVAAAAAARQGRPRLPQTGAGPIRWVAAVLVGAIVGAVLFDTARAMAGVSGTTASAAADLAARRPAVAVATAGSQDTAGTVRITDAGVRPTLAAYTQPITAVPTHTIDHEQAGPAEVPAWASDAPGGIHPVRKGDNLWDIAAHTLGDPHRWREIYTLTRGHEQADGYALTDPNEIHVGWVLALPARHHPDTAHAPAPTADHAPAADPHHGDPAPTPPTHGDPAPGTTAPATRPPDDGVDAPEPVPTVATPRAVTSPVPSASALSTGTPAASASPSPSLGASGTPTPTAPGTNEQHAPDSSGDHTDRHDEAGVILPSQGWISLGLAAVIASVAALVRLQRRRHARLAFPISTTPPPAPGPVPDELSLAEMFANHHHRLTSALKQRHEPTGATVQAPIGVDATGADVSLFELPGPGVALVGEGADPAARAILVTCLGTGAAAFRDARPIVVTTTGTLARLLPENAPLVGIDPDSTAYDGERLIIVTDTAAAITHAEEEMILRRRLLDAFDLDTITDLNARTDHAEQQPPYVLLLDAPTRHTGRLLAVSAHRQAVHLHPVVLGALDGIPTTDIAADGTTLDPAGVDGVPVRWSSLAAEDLAAMLTMLTDAAARPEPGHDIDHDPPPAPITTTNRATPDTDSDGAPLVEAVPVASTDTPAPVRACVLGPITVNTDAGTVAIGRTGSRVVLACLAAHPGGRTVEQLAADLHPDTDLATAGNRIRTDVSTLRRVLRTATGQPKATFVIHDTATGRYLLDPDLITVDLWQMLTAIQTANIATTEQAALVGLREAADLYGGDFAEGHDRPWIGDYATNYRHMILAVHARIAELLETEHPDQAVNALERASELDPVNEELYQRIMRIHGRAARPDAVRRTLRRLEERLMELGYAEPSEATRRVAQRQLRPIPPTTHGSGARR